MTNKVLGRCACVLGAVSVASAGMGGCVTIVPGDAMDVREGAVVTAASAERAPPEPAALPAATGASEAPSPVAAASPAELVEQERLVATIQALPTRRAFAGSPEQIAGLDAARDQLLAAAKAMGYDASLQTVHWSRRRDPSPRDWHNVVFELAGTGPRAREVIVVGAHYDAVPTTPGADDNASGVAALMEIARVLKAWGPHQRTVRFVLFTLEEGPLAGSRQYAQALKDEVDAKKVEVVLMLSLEMLGFYSQEPASQRNPFKHVPGAPQRDVADFVALCGHSRDAAGVSALARAMKAAQPAVEVVEVAAFPNEQIPMMPPDLLRSDHAPFITLEMPGVMVTDTSEFRNSNYHKPTDTLETLNLPYYTRTVRALAGAVHALAGPMGSDAPMLGRSPAPGGEGQ